MWYGIVRNEMAKVPRWEKTATRKRVIADSEYEKWAAPLARTRAAAAGAPASRWSITVSVWNGDSRSRPVMRSGTRVPSIWTWGGAPTASRTSPARGRPP
jgi:hypothetical protein